VYFQPCDQRFNRQYHREYIGNYFDRDDPRERDNIKAAGVICGISGSIIGTIITLACGNSITASSAGCLITTCSLVGTGLGVGTCFARKKLMHVRRLLSERLAEVSERLEEKVKSWGREKNMKKCSKKE
jgi:hypothetical protein